MGASSMDEERQAFLDLELHSPVDGESDLQSTQRNNQATLPIRILQALATYLGCRRRTLHRSIRRHPRQFCSSILRYLVVFVVTVFTVVPIFFPSYTNRPAHYEDLAKGCGPGAPRGCANKFNEKVFIAVSLYDRAGNLAGGRWGQQLLELIDMIGPENTFLSIYENDSPGGKVALEELRGKVSCKHSIVYEDHVQLDNFENVTMPNGQVVMKRVAYMTEVRNPALAPLDMLDPKGYVEQYDKVLHLNDVHFPPIEAAQLLFSTNVNEEGRSEYLSVCALDYDNPWYFYDLFAMRDFEGFSNGNPIYPIFSNAGQGISRRDMLDQKDAVRVSACWGGMVAMQAKYLQNKQPKLATPDFRSHGAHVIDPDKPHNIEAPVRFRHEPDIFYDACECCLLLADVSEAAALDTSNTVKGVYVNPYVRVAYSESTLYWQRIIQRWERILPPFHAVISYLSGLPRHNPFREVKQGDKYTDEVWNNVTNAWELRERIGRSGMFCGVREMEVINYEARTEDKNWHDTKMPAGMSIWFPT